MTRLSDSLRGFQYGLVINAQTTTVFTQTREDLPGAISRGKDTGVDLLD